MHKRENNLISKFKNVWVSELSDNLRVQAIQTIYKTIYQIVLFNKEHSNI